MGEQKYVYAAGVATGLIMAVVSILTAFQMVKYVQNGGPFLVLVLVSLLVGMAVGLLISFLVSIIMKRNPED